MDQQEEQHLSEILIQIPMEASAGEEEHLETTFEMNDLEHEEHEELEIVKLESKNVKKRVSLTIEKKIEIIQRHESGVSQKNLAMQYNVGRTTISDILKRKYKFLKFLHMNADKTENLKRRRTLRRTVHKALEDKLFEWYNELRESGQFVSGPMVANKARELHKELGYTDSFTASNGWLDRFKLRNGIKLCGLREVKCESDVNAVGPFKTELESLMQWYNLTTEQVYNADETDLFWKMLPNPESDVNEVKSSVRAYRERMTVLCCSNATGTHKLPLVCIGRGKKSRIFSANEIKQLPVHYYSQETAWMDNEIFKNWFHAHFVPSVREHLRSQNLPETALLLIDRNPSHPSDQHLRSEDNFFFVQYFPAKVKSLVQPMEQGLIRDIKLHYRYDLLVEMINKNLGINEFHKQLNIKDAIYRIYEGWNALTSENIQICFSKIFPMTESNSITESNFSVPTTEHFMELLKGIPECQFNKYTAERLKNWLNCDDAEPKKDCNSLYAISEEFKDSVKEEEVKLVFDNYSEELSQTVEIKSSTELQNDDENLLPNNVSEYEILDDTENIEMITNEPSNQEGFAEISIEHDISEENILYEEGTECEITCEQAINALDIVLKFMKCDSESRYRDVVFLSELKKKLRNRMNDE